MGENSIIVEPQQQLFYCVALGTVGSSWAAEYREQVRGGRGYKDLKSRVGWGKTI